MIKEEIKQLSEQRIDDFAFELEEIPGDTLPEVQEGHTVIDATLWFSSMPTFRTTQRHYRLLDEDKMLNADSIEVALRGNAFALIDTAKRWHSESGGVDEFLSAVEVLQAETTLNCVDCGVNTREIGHDYMFRDRLWISIRPECLGKLCLTCAQARLGRPLTLADFTDVPVNREIDQLLARIRSDNQRPR